MRIRPFAGVRRAVGGVRVRLQRQTPLVTSFLNLRGRWVVQQFLSDLAARLSPLQRVVAVAHLPAVVFLPASFVFFLCVLDFLFLPPKVLLSSVIVVCAVRLWEELQARPSPSFSHSISLSLSFSPSRPLSCAILSINPFEGSLSRQILV